MERCIVYYFKRFVAFLKRIMVEPNDVLAREAGVSIGVNCEVFSKFWLPSEPYLISVGDNCQITKGVKFFTHGG